MYTYLACMFIIKSCIYMYVYAHAPEDSSPKANGCIYACTYACTKVGFSTFHQKYTHACMQVCQMYLCTNLCFKSPSLPHTLSLMWARCLSMYACYSMCVDHGWVSVCMHSVYTSRVFVCMFCSAYLCVHISCIEYGWVCMYVYSMSTFPIHQVHA
jgi:hypothetical protein